MWINSSVRLLDHLEQEGDYADNTLLMFTCDNGTGRGITTQTTGGPVKGGKSLPNDAGMHVPLIASWPGSRNWRFGVHRTD